MAEQTKFVYNSDGVKFTIYKSIKPTKSGPKAYWLLEDWSTGKRRTLNNVSREAAERRADHIRAAMFKGQAHQLLFSHGQMQDVYTALEALRRAKSFESLGTVVRLWLECTMMLGGRATPLDAVKFYLANHRGNGPQPKPIRFDEAAKLYHAFKVASKKSASHCGNILSRMNRVTAKLPAGIVTDEPTAGQLDQVVVGLGLAPKTRNEYRILLSNFYKWAGKQGPPLVPKGFNPAKDMERYDVPDAEVEFLHVLELKQILTALPAKSKRLPQHERVEGYQQPVVLVELVEESEPNRNELGWPASTLGRHALNGVQPGRQCLCLNMKVQRKPPRGGFEI